MIALTLFVFVSSLLFLYILLAPYRRKLPSRIPRPPGVPFFGHALRFTSTSAILKVFTEYLRKYGGVYQIQVGPIPPNVVFASPKNVELVLSSTRHLDKSLDYNFLHNWLGMGLLTSTGTKWKKHRRIITPTFHFKVLEDFVEVFNLTGEIFIDKLRSEVGNTSFNIVPYLSLYTLDSICESAMGLKINAQRYPTSEYVTSVKEMCRIVMTRAMSAIKRHDFFYRFTSDYMKEQKALKVLHGFSMSVISKRKQELLKNKECNMMESSNEFGIKRRKAFLDLLLESSEKESDPLTDEELREEVDTFMFEGHDTTTSALSFACYCLAENPDVQKIAYEEQVSIFGEDMKRNITLQDLQGMQYLEMVLKETLRIYPSVPFYTRKLCEDFQFEGEKIPKDTEIGIFAYGIHHDPNVYQNPEKFDPERFAGSVDRSPYAYIPFSAGSRNCIGQRFAMMEMKATLSKVLRNFEVIPASPRHELDLAFEVVLVSRNGVRIALRNR